MSFVNICHTLTSEVFNVFLLVFVSSGREDGTESPKGLSNSGNSFVFGQKMGERVMVSIA